MNKFNKIVFISFASLILAACGGGGGSDEPSKPTQPSRAAGMYMSAISNPVNLTVKQVTGGNRTALKAAKVETKANEGTGIDPMVGLYATDEGGKEFRIHFELTDDKGVTTGYDEKVEPTSVIQITPDTVYLELLVRVNTNNLTETRQYLVQFSTGKMIEVQRLALGDAFLNQAYKYVLPANSLHNGTNYPIVLLKDNKWYQLDADWNSLTFAKEPVSSYVFDAGVQGPAGNILITADKQEYRIEGYIGGNNASWHVTHNNQVVYQGMAGMWLADDGQVVVSNNGGLFYAVMKDGVESLEQFSDYDYTAGSTSVINQIVAKAGEYYLGTNCRVMRDNNGVMETVSDSSSDSEAFYSAGAKSLVCVDKPDEDFDYMDLEAYCGETHVWDMFSVATDGSARRSVKLNAMPYLTTQVTEDTAYAMLRECVKNADGSWSLSFNHSLINFADNSITPIDDIVSVSAFIH